MATDLSAQLDALIKAIESRNTETQTQKQNGVWGYIVAIILALINVAAIAYAMYQANKQAKELAATKTELEQLKVDQAQQQHEAQAAQEKSKREQLEAEARLMAAVIKNREEELAKRQKEHDERQKKLESLKAWEDINAA